jgi:hypothetical protein
MGLTGRTVEDIMSTLSRLAWVFIALVPLAALADEPTAGTADPSNRLTVDKDKKTHITTISAAKDIPIELQANLKGPSCNPTMAIQYEQRNTVARVEGTIENPSCAACTGEYTMVVRIRDESGESKTLEFPAKWQRADDKPVKFTADYPVGANVDVLNVRPKGLHCVCAAAEQPASADSSSKE